MVRFVDPVPRDQAARLRRFCEEALVELDAELDLPVHVVDRHRPDGPLLAPGVVGWASGTSGIFLCRDLLERADKDVFGTVVEEIGHYYLARAHPRLAASELHSEAFACWLVGRTCRTVWVPNVIDSSTGRYTLGRAVGAALAGADEAREQLAAIGYCDLLDLLDRLDGEAAPRDLALQLVGELGGR